MKYLASTAPLPIAQKGIAGLSCNLNFSKSSFCCLLCHCSWVDYQPQQQDR